MTLRSTFQINVNLKDGMCAFALSRNDQNQSLISQTQQEYSQELQQCFRHWRENYVRCLRLKRSSHNFTEGSQNRGGPLVLNPIAIGKRLGELEHQLLEEFQRWLKQREIRQLERKMLDSFVEDEISSGIDIFLECSDDDLRRLPWEVWPEWLTPLMPQDKTVRLIRTVAETTKTEPEQRIRKTRILAIWGEDPKLNLEPHWKAIESLKSLKSVDIVERVGWQPEDNREDIRKKVLDSIEDERGWDILFFVGHSHETGAGGSFSLTPEIAFSIYDIKERLENAQKNGLKLAVFTSCCGLNIAQSLTELGIQTLVMREPFHKDAAQIFLKQFCQSFGDSKNPKDVHEAMLEASRYLKSEETLNHPSTYLIPSFFSPAGIPPFRLKPYGWKEVLRKAKPRKREMGALGSIFLLSLMIFVQDLLFDSRLFVQALYRHWTNQVPQNPSPPVLVVSIDSNSLQEAREWFAENSSTAFEVRPMDRRYLAQLVNQLSQLGVSTIGIDYRLNQQKKIGDRELANSLQSAVSQQQTWFIFAANEYKKRKVSPAIASSNWSFQGDTTFFPWEMELPKNITCPDSCPFAYLLALSHVLKQNSANLDLPTPNLQSKTDFQEQVHHYLNQEDSRKTLLKSLQRSRSPLGLSSIIDFSIPPEITYERISAAELLQLNASYTKQQQGMEQQVAIIASGDYGKALDSFPKLLATKYWCYGFNPGFNECSGKMSGGEVHAYMLSQLLSNHRVISIPTLWLIILGAIFEKWVTLKFETLKRLERRQWLWKLALATGLWGIFSLQLFISASVLIPWLLPWSIFWIFVLRRKARV